MRRDNSSTRSYFFKCDYRGSDLWPSLNILTKQPLLIECVARLSRNGIDGALVDLLLDCTQQKEERLAHSFLQKMAQGWSQQALPLTPNALPPSP